MSTLDNILATTRSQIDDLRAESADHAREATKLAEQMADPTDAYRAMEAEHRDLLLKVAALEDEMRTARSALDAMADERKTHLDKADAAADCADHFETRTLPGLAEILDGADIPPREALTATGLMPKDIPVEEHTCANMGCTSCAGCDGCTCHDPAHTCLPWDASTQTECPACREIAGNGKPVNGDNLPPAARTPAEVNAALTPPVPHEPAGPDATHCPTCESPEPSLHPAVSGGGEVTHICDDPFHGPVPQDPAGQPVATHGPTVTMPDTGLNPDPLPPAPPTAEPRHAKPDRPGLLARLTGGHRIVHDAQDGDDRG